MGTFAFLFVFCITISNQFVELQFRRNLKSLEGFGGIRRVPKRRRCRYHVVHPREAEQPRSITSRKRLALFFLPCDFGGLCDTCNFDSGFN